jgi:prolipoprotein diacylglyceryl transferase
MYWDPNPVALRVGPWPVLWYGVFFALAFFLAFPLFVAYMTPYLTLKGARCTADRFLGWIIGFVLLGARVGHLVFYEHPHMYLTDPLILFRLREGGLASHGAVVGLLLAPWLFLRWHRELELSYRRLLDAMALVAPWIGGWIRLGNFWNQEILGIPTTVPWGVVFGHPMDRSSPLPRHPVQLYEALFYWILFGVVYWMWKKGRKGGEGVLAGGVLITIFSFRWVVEFFKEEQSSIALGSWTMGQVLSIPCILIGGILCWGYAQMNSKVGF